MKRIAIIIILMILMINLIGCKDDNNEEPNVATVEYITVTEHEIQIANLQSKLENQGLELEEKLKASDNKTITHLVNEFKGDSAINILKYNASTKQVAYIDGVGFETIGNVQLLDIETEETNQLTLYDYGDSQMTVKDLYWYNDNELLLIVGYSYGTVTVGGSLYLLDINTNEMKEVIVPNEGEEVIGVIEPTNGSSITVVYAKWDENYLNYETYSVDYDKDELER